MAGADRPKIGKFKPSTLAKTTPKMKLYCFKSPFHLKKNHFVLQHEKNILGVIILGEGGAPSAFWGGLAPLGPPVATGLLCSGMLV